MLVLLMQMILLRCWYSVAITGARFALSILFTISTNFENTIQAIWGAISIHYFLFQELDSLTLNTFSSVGFSHWKRANFLPKLFQFGEDIFESEHYALRHSLPCNYADIALNTLPLQHHHLNWFFTQLVNSLGNFTFTLRKWSTFLQNSTFLKRREQIWYYFSLNTFAFRIFFEWNWLIIQDLKLN
jgi:hypothetical protein